MNTLALMARAAVDFRVRLMSEPDCTALPLPGAMTVPEALRWDNTLLRTDVRARACRDLRCPKTAQRPACLRLPAS